MAKKLILGGVNITSLDDDYGYPYQVPITDPETDYFYYINSYIEIEDGSVNLKDSASGFTTTLKSPATPTEDHEIRLPDGAADGAGKVVKTDGAGNWYYDTGGGGSGDVVGPASATDNAIARYDGTTGELIQNSGATIDDSGNLSANNISGTNTGDQNLFGTIAVAGQTDVVADSIGDILTLVAGANIAITTNAGTDTVTFAVTGMTAGDVVGPASATDNAIARYDGTTGELIQDSGATIDDSGNIETTGNVTADAFRSNGDGGGDPHLDGYILAADTQPAVRVTSYPTARVELGPGGSTAADVAFLRTGTNAAALALGGSNQITFSTSAIAFAPTLEVGQNGIKFYEDVANGTNSVKLVSNAALAGDLVFYLPIADGTNGQFIKTNGSGQLSFATATGGAGIDVYDDPDTLVAAGDSTAGSVVMIKGYGMATWYATQSEPEDYETVFNTTTGQWVLELVHPDLPYYLFGVIVGDGGSNGQYLQTNGNGTYSWVTSVSAEITDWVSASPVANKSFTSLSANTIEFEFVVTVATAAAAGAVLDMRINGISAGYSYWGFYEDDSLNAWTRYTPVTGQTEAAVLYIDAADTDGQQIRCWGSITVLPSGKMAYRAEYESFATAEGGFFRGYGSGFGASGITSIEFLDSLAEFQFAVGDYIKLWRKR